MSLGVNSYWTLLSRGVIIKSFVMGVGYLGVFPFILCIFLCIFRLLSQRRIHFGWGFELGKSP